MVHPLIISIYSSDWYNDQSAYFKAYQSFEFRPIVYLFTPSFIDSYWRNSYTSCLFWSMSYSQRAFLVAWFFYSVVRLHKETVGSVQCQKLWHQFPYKYYTPATEPTFGSSKKVGCWTINNWQWQEDRAIWWEPDGSCHKKELIFAEHTQCFSCRICLEWKVIMSTCLIDGESMYSNGIWTNSEKRIDIVCMFVWQWGLQGKYLQYQPDWILGSQTKVSWGGI